MDMETMNSRLVVMMRPSEKKRLEARAKALKLSPSELVRRAAESYDATDPDDPVLEALVTELEAAVKTMRKDFKEIFSAMDEHRKAMAQLKAGRPKR
jgi:methylphosphotriester-DNA--protein-cysteine methyltransferase